MEETRQLFYHWRIIGVTFGGIIHACYSSPPPHHGQSFVRSTVGGEDNKSQNTHRLVNTSRSIQPRTVQHEKCIQKRRPGFLPEGTSFKEKALLEILLQAIWQTGRGPGPSTYT